jgi:hypothetical protein
MTPQQEEGGVNHISTVTMHSSADPRWTKTTSVNLEGLCRWCSGYHSGTCPKVKAIEYHPNGSVKRVEFK